jgi:hypothetical protein
MGEFAVLAESISLRRRLALMLKFGADVGRAGTPDRSLDRSFPGIMIARLLRYPQRLLFHFAGTFVTIMKLKKEHKSL